LVLYSDLKMRSPTLILLPLICQCLSAQQASFGGVAINAVTRKPLDGVNITIYVPGPAGSPTQTYGATSGKDGRFSIPHVNPGGYGLLVRRNGFVYLQDENKEASHRGVTLKAGDAVTDHTVEMTPEAVISGRVVDDYGDPVERAYVRASAVGSDSSMSPVLSRMNSITDERGQFRIVGAPGKFHVGVSAFRAQTGIHEIRTDGSEIPVYGETWYPGSDSENRAGVVEAVGGRETAGIDIRLLRKRSLTISGVVTGTPEGTARTQVFLNTKFSGFPTAIPDADGRFTFSGLPPDQYRVKAIYDAPGSKLISPTADVTLETASNTSVSLNLAPGEEVSGTLEVEGGPSSEKRTVGLEAPTPQDYVPVHGGEVDRDGKFSIAPVYPGKFRVHVEPLPENAFIKTVSADGGAVADTVVDLSRGVRGSKIKITIGLNGGTVEGTVSSESGKPACCAMVVLAAKIEEVNDYMKSVKAGERYRFAGLRPGKYRLIVAGPEQAYGTQTAEELFPKAPEIEVHEGDRITLDVTIKPRGTQ
jgi:Protein of unknown function (DUF1416)